MAVRFGEKVGDAYVDVHARGDGFDRDVRRIGSKAGVTGGNEFKKSFAKTITKDQGVFEKAFRGISGRFASILQANKSIRSFSDSWANLSHNTKQWTLIIGAVLAGMQQIAVLGSAAAAGLLVLGGAAGGVAVGLGAMVTAFIGLGGELDKLPPSVRPAAKAFQDLLDPLKGVQDLLQERAFKDAAPAFRSIGTSIRKLTPAFGPLGDAIGRIVTDFSEWLASEEGLRLMNSLITNSARIFEKTTGLVGKLGKAFLNAFDNPKFQKAIDDMLTGLGGMFDTFAEFTASDEFGTWIENTGEILGELGELIGATSEMFRDLVTPEAYERTKKFLDNLTNFMPHLGELLDVLGRLDIFGILAQALADLGEALSPLAEPFGDLAEAIGEIVGIAIDQWGKDLKPVAEALAPFVQGLADLIKDVPPEVIRAIASALLALGGAILALKVGSAISSALGLTAFFGAIGKGAPIMKNFPLAKLKSFGKGIAAIGLLTATTLIPDDFWDQFDIESNLPNNVLTGAAFGSMFGLWGAVIGAGIGVVVSLFTEFEATMNDIGSGLLGLFAGGPLGLFGAQVADFFAGLVPEEWQSSDNPMERFLSALAFTITDTGTALTLVGQMISDFFNNLNFDQKATEIAATWTELWSKLSIPTWDQIGATINAWLTSVGLFFTVKVMQVQATWNAFWSTLGTTVTGYVKAITLQVQVWLFTIQSRFKVGLNGALAGWNNFWGSIPRAVSSAVNTVIGYVNNLMGVISRALGAITGLNNASRGAGGGGGGASNVPRFASGGILNGPRRILAGEDGPEAIVPLRRHLNRVDPSVRWLSALAQGKTPAMASGGVVGGGRTVAVEAGAIVVQEANSALATGVEVLDRLAARLA